jgi:hypothetical protein
MNKYEYKIKIPLTANSGKFRIKSRNMLYEYGLPVATKSQEFAQNHYVEWQIGYDATLKDINSEKKKTSISHLTFVGANGLKKTLYELSEYIYDLLKNNIIKKDEIIKIKKFITQIPNNNLLDSCLNIKRLHPKIAKYNNIKFEQSTVEYPLLVHKFKQYELITEIITREKQYAIGIMPMLYFCFPVTNLTSDINLIGRTAETKEVAYFIINKRNANVFLKIIKIFGTLSKTHQYDILQILDILIKNT